MTKDQLNFVREAFRVFGWPDDTFMRVRDQEEVIEIDGNYITIGNGLLWISEIDIASHTCASHMSGFQLEISKVCPGNSWDANTDELVLIASERHFRDIVVRAIGCFAEYKALAAIILVIPRT